MKPFFRTAVFSTLLLLLTPAALAQDGFRATIGVKAWVHTWSTWIGPASDGGVSQIESDNETAIIPSVTLRYRNFFLSGDFFPEKEYNFLNNALRKVKRDEWSVVGGYYLAPQLAVALGYKRIHQDFGSTIFNMNIDVPMVGLQGGALVGDSGNWFLYGNGFVGSISVKTASTGATQNWDGWYYSTELGLGFRLFERLSATAGYKYQTVRWESVNRQAPGYDYTMGWIFGLSYTF